MDRIISTYLEKSKCDEVWFNTRIEMLDYKFRTKNPKAYDKYHQIIRECNEHHFRETAKRKRADRL